MKTLIKMTILLFCVTAFSQEQKVDYEKLDNNLVKVTYYFTDNNTIVQREGFFNKEGKLQDTWVSYDLEGNKMVIANYKNGKKDGIWTYFKKDKINIVTYKDNKIVNVEERALAVN